MSVRTGRGLARRAVALLLSWVFTATTFWSMAPPVAEAAPVPRGPLPSLIAGFPENLSRGDDHGDHGDAGRASRWRRSRRTGPRRPRAGARRARDDGGGAPDPRVRGGARAEPVHGLLRLQEREPGGGDDPGGGGATGSRPRRRTAGSRGSSSPGGRPYYPNAAFAVPFDGQNLEWTLKGPDDSAGPRRRRGARSRCTAPPPPVPTCDTTFFGPRRYTRTNGAPDVFDETIAVPAWVASPYVLRIQNGEAGGQNRVSSATIVVNGVEVAPPLGPEPERGRSRAGGRAHAHDGAAGDAREQPGVLPDAEPVRDERRTRRRRGSPGRSPRRALTNDRDAAPRPRVRGRGGEREPAASGVDTGTPAGARRRGRPHRALHEAPGRRERGARGAARRGDAPAGGADRGPGRERRRRRRPSSSGWT